MPDDDALLQSWRQGDLEAGNALFDRHFKTLYAFFRNKVSEGIDDLVQQTFLACVEGRDRLRGEATFRTYMFAVARRILYRTYEKSQRHAVDFGVTSLHDLDPSPSQILAQRAQHQLLIAALRRIPIDYQVALELYYVQGLHGPELALILDVPEATVRSRLRRGLEQLRKHIAQMHEARELLASTCDGLESWAASLRGAFERNERSQRVPSSEP